MLNFITEYNIGGVILFDEDLNWHSGTRNIESPDQLKDLTDKLQNISENSLFIAIDQEGGKVTRLKQMYGFKNTPSGNISVI